MASFYIPTEVGLAEKKKEWRGPLKGWSGLEVRGCFGKEMGHQCGRSAEEDGGKKGHAKPQETVTMSFQGRSRACFEICHFTIW